MKKSLFISLFFILIVSLQVRSQQLKIAEAVRYDGVITLQDLQTDKPSLHPAAARAMARGEKPGTFSDVSFRYAGNVRTLTPAQKSGIRLKQDGILDLTAGAFRPHPDSVYIDPESDLVMQAEPVDDNQMIALRPPLTAVFDDIEVPEQQVPITLANTVSLAQGVVESSLQLNNSYAVNLQFDSVTFLIDKTENDSLTVTLDGQIVIANPRVEGKYSKNNGYRLVFLASEQVDMKIYTSMKLQKEVKTPIWGTEIEMSDLGKCEIGLFILGTLEGHVTLAVEIHQGIEMAMGARGGTFWYIPTSIHNVSTLNYWCDVGYEITSQMKAFMGFQCTANLKVKGYNALDVYVNGGMEGTVATDGMTLDADIGLRLKAGGKIVSKKFTLLDSYYSLWKYKKPDYHGYDMVIHEACAWGDYVAGEVHSLVPGNRPGILDTIPYTGSLTVIVDHPAGSNSEYTVNTDVEGIFIARDVPLKNGDRVMVRLAGVPNASPAVEATIPFKEIRLWSADYFAGLAEGSVAGSRSKWARLAASSQAVAPGAAAALAGSSMADRFREVIPQQEAVKRINEFRNSLTVYRGPIEFVTQTGHTAVLRDNAPLGTVPQGTKPQGTTPQGTKAQGAAAQVSSTRSSATKATAPRATAAQGARAQATAPQASRFQTLADIPMANRGTVDSPLGTFSVTGLTFEPGQKVKARAVIEGFTIESEWVETEGVLVSAIEHEGLSFSSRPGLETVSADNSFVVVSAIHGETAPTGNVRLVKGADAPHASLTAADPVPEFPEAKRAKVWFSKSVPLEPLEGHPGTAIASTGPWSVAYSYMSPGDAIIPDKNRKHPFEMVTYVFKNKNLGYSIFIDECASCTSTANVVERIGKEFIPGQSEMPRGPVMQPKMTVPAKQQQVTQPKIIR
jgi:hypothetical protein